MLILFSSVEGFHTFNNYRSLNNIKVLKVIILSSLSAFDFFVPKFTEVYVLFVHDWLKVGVKGLLSVKVPEENWLFSSANLNSFNFYKHTNFFSPMTDTTSGNDSHLSLMKRWILDFWKAYQTSVNKVDFTMVPLSDINSSGSLKVKQNYGANVFVPNDYYGSNITSSGDYLNEPVYWN